MALNSGLARTCRTRVQRTTGVQAPSPDARHGYLEQATGNGEVLEEMDHLVLIGEVAVKEDRAAGRCKNLGQGAWFAENGVYRQASTVDGTRSLTGASTNDHVVQVRVRPTAFNGADRWVGLLARYENDSNYVYVTLRSSNVLSLRRLSFGQQGDALILAGQRREEREEGADDQDYRMFERSYGSFYRTVPLPQGTNPDEIEAVMRDGALKITLPIAESARPKKIRIQS